MPDDEDEEKDEAFAVWSVNWRSLVAFLACETQWRCVARGMTGAMMWLGIDYAAARPVYARRNRASERRLLADLRIMEREALDALEAVAE